MYSHDSFGLGHLRRTLALAEAFVEHDPGASVLILTGSTVSGTFRMSRGIDIVKLPSAVKVANGVYEPSRMQIGFETLRNLRSSLILSTVEAFTPDAFVVDKAPLGMKREVIPALKLLRSEWPSTLTVLGLRDVMDDPARIRRDWREGRIAPAIENFYDTIQEYGPREIYDPLPEYGLSDATLPRCHYVGYVGRASTPEETSAPVFESLVVTGPMMDDESKRKIERLARGLRVRVMEFRADMERLIRRAGAVVSMGGYNSTIELLVARKPALIVPRVEPRLEQLIRAEHLADLGLVD